MAFYVYCLLDPRNDDIRYVGYTNDPARRLRKHMSRVRLRGQTHKENWLKQLIALDLCPHLVLVAKRETRDEIQVAEREAIAELRAQGHDLTNATPGGDGGPTIKGWKLPMEWVEKVANARRGRKFDLEPSTRASLAANASRRFSGVPLSPEHRQKIGEASRRRSASAETRQKISEATTGRYKGLSWRMVDGKRVWLPRTDTKSCVCGSSGPFYKSPPSPDGFTARCCECIKRRNRKESDATRAAP